MKRNIVIVFFVLLILIILSASYEQGGMAASKQRQITGSITAIDIKNKTVTVTKENKKVNLNITEKTKISQCTDGKITDINIGDKVTARYKESTDRNVSNSIMIRKTNSGSD
jgi:Cu/Ag efflux protein CusF